MSGAAGTAERAERAWALLRELLRVDTTNPPGNEAAAAELLARFLKEAGLEPTRADPAPARANAVWRTGPADAALLLAAHLDVVPAARERWSADPFGAEEKDGYLYGRGAIDMKHFAAMSAVLLAQASRRSLRRGLVFAAMADEEAGCALGSRFLVEKHPELIRAEYSLGEGGGFTQYAGAVRFCPIGRAEKGHLVVRLKFRGKAGHASMPHPENPAFIAAEALARLKPGVFAVRVTEPAADFLRALGAASGPVGLALKGLASEALAPGLLGVLPKEFSLSLRPLLGHTVSPTRLRGAEAVNIIPELVTVDLDIRVLPGFTAEAALAELWEGAGAELEHEVLEFNPGVESPVDTPLYARLEAAVRAHDPASAPVPFLIPGFTDASFLRRVTKASYGFAPLVLGERDAHEFKLRMHGSDERVAKDAFARGYAMLEDAVLGFLT